MREINGLFLDESPAGIVVRDLEGRYIYGNQRAHVDLASDVPLAGRTLEDIFSPEAAEMMRARDREVAETGESSIVDAQLVLPDGVERTLAIAQHRVVLPDGEPLVVSVVIDRTGADRMPSEPEIRFQQLIASIEDVFILSAMKPPVALYASPNLTDVYGLDVETLNVRNLLDRVHPDDRAILTTAIGGLRPPHLESEVEYRIVHPDKGVRWVKSRTRPVEGPSGDPRMVTVINDITADVELREEIVRARDDAEAANARKDQLLSHVSHELRTPLHAILGFTQLLEWEDGTLSPEQIDCVHQIRRAGSHLLDLINELLDVQRIERGVLGLALEDVDVGDAVRDTVDLLAVHAAGQGVDIVTAAPNGPVTALADRQRLIQVLINLIANAIKFNRSGGTVTVRWLPPSEGAVRIEVGDDGAGIAPDDLDRLFTPFERLGVDDEVEGTGVGLALSRQLVEAMSGSIDVESRLGEGTTFGIALPAAS